MSPASPLGMKLFAYLAVFSSSSLWPALARAQTMVCRGPEIKLEIGVAQPPNDSIVQVIRKIDGRTRVTEILHRELDIQANGSALTVMDKFLREALSGSANVNPRQAAQGAIFALFFDSRKNGFVVLGGQDFDLSACASDNGGGQ